ncbi:hypothetical protein BJX61DRAFT_532249 [Aspergillus egyptiacus]|nr:hypothetical protein BJX61DRAFT_532249 [Aspergillus egyptiacus]
MQLLQPDCILDPLLEVATSLALLPLNNTVLVATLVSDTSSSICSRPSPSNRRQALLRDVKFHPKTILVTGINTPHGLRVARCFYEEGHRVVGAEINDSYIASGESMSRALSIHYSVPKSQYVSDLLHIVQREKVDVWIPCSSETTIAVDSMAKQAIESRTSCRCVSLDPGLAMQWSRPESFTQYLIDNDLPFVERHQVQSRDSIHRILHRSPTKSYQIRRLGPVGQEQPIVLPKSTMSLTYSQVSELQISKDSPWLMQQHTRLGEFIAELLVVRGHVTAISVHSASEESDWARSPLNDGLAAAIQKLMESLASKGGPRMAGHLNVRLMVDKELTTNSVRYVVHIASCTQGSAAISHLLQNTPPRSLVGAYLEILSDDSVAPNCSPEILHGCDGTSVSKPPFPKPSLYEAVKGYDVRKVLPALYPVAQRIDRALDEACELLVFWEDWRFSSTDPLPWWWNAHVTRPLRMIEQLMKRPKK